MSTHMPYAANKTSHTVARIAHFNLRMPCVVTLQCFVG